jgi:surfactin synthase thioesterase subunit
VTQPVDLDSKAWIRNFRPAPDAAVQLVCFPHAGGSASFYFPVAAALAPRVDVLAVQYPGRQDRRLEPGVEDIVTLAGYVHAALRTRIDRPVALFGHSMGAVVAFEVARLLERDPGVEVVRLFASGRRAPSTHRVETVHLRDDDGLVAELRTLSGTDSRILGDEELLRMILPAIRSDYRAIETYVGTPEQTVRTPITVLVGDSDSRVTLDEARQWQVHTTGECAIRTFPGGHFYLVQQHVQVNGLIAAALLG